MIVDEESIILPGIHKASVFSLVSFCRSRLSLTAIAKYLPELAPTKNFFGKHSLSKWSLEMSLYNQICKTTSGMGMITKEGEQHLLYDSLDLFLLQVHPDKLAQVFDSWVSFAERMVPLIRARSDARSWKLNRKIIIYRRHWLLLSKRVMNVVTTIGRLTGVDFRNQVCCCSAGHDILITSAGRAALMYGGFLLGKRCRPGMTEIHNNSEDSSIPPTSRSIYQH